MNMEMAECKKDDEMQARSVSSHVEGAVEMLSTSERSGEMRDLEKLGQFPQPGPDTIVEVPMQSKYNLLSNPGLNPRYCAEQPEIRNMQKNSRNDFLDSVSPRIGCTEGVVTELMCKDFTVRNKETKIRSSPN